MGKSTLIQALCSNDSSSTTTAGRAAAAAAAATAPPPARAAPQQVLHLDTKYYTADAAVRVRSLHDDDEQQEEADEPDAVVLVFAAADAASLAAAQRWAAARTAPAADVQLLVANKCDALVSRPAGGAAAEREGLYGGAAVPAAAAWCLDNGFEYVEAAAGAPAADAALCLDGDRQGVARVREALEAHAWPGLSLKGRGGCAAATAGGAEAAGSVEPADGSGDEVVAPPQASQLAAAAAARGGCANTAAALGTGASLGRGQSSARSSSGGDDDEEEEEDEGKLEENVESFEQLMSQLQGARERLAKLPDSERRAQAAALAMRFAAMLGDEGGESDDEPAEAAGGGQRRVAP